MSVDVLIDHHIVLVLQKPLCQLKAPEKHFKKRIQAKDACCGLNRNQVEVKHHVR
jgi:hypothetical protein